LPDSREPKTEDQRSTLLSRLLEVFTHK
jgi:hypothetical protein